MVCLPVSHCVGAMVMKNCEPLVLGPEFAMASLPGLSNCGVSLGFVFELVAGAAEAGAGGISALDHEVGNHAMEDGAVVEAVFALLAADGMGPLAFAFGEFDEVGDGFGGFFLEQAADDGAFTGIEAWRKYRVDEP